METWKKFAWFFKTYDEKNDSTSTGFLIIVINQVNGKHMIKMVF